MPLPYSQDLRDRVLAACDRAMKTKEIADLFGVSRSWVRRVKQRRREYGEITPRPPEPTARYTKIDRDRLRELVEAHPDATLGELRSMLGVQCAESAIWRALDKMGYTFKKRQSMQQSRIGRMSRPVVSSGSGSRARSTPGD
jgi:transposase